MLVPLQLLEPIRSFCVGSTRGGAVCLPRSTQQSARGTPQAHSRLLHIAVRCLPLLLTPLLDSDDGDTSEE